jgi:bifunctional aspartokinase / homoserine dehydrogenase 1
MKVLKFGGSSVRDAEAIEQVVQLIRQAASESRCAVVLSVMEGTTDALIAARTMPFSFIQIAIPNSRSLSRVQVPM